MQDKATFTSSMIEGFLFVRDWVLHATHAVSDLRSNLAGRLVLPALSDKVSEAERGRGGSGGGRCAPRSGSIAAFIRLLPY